MKQAGYATACFRKWNIGFAPGSRPLDRGFDEFLGDSMRAGAGGLFTMPYTWRSRSPPAVT
jgi:arylsulfatase A-like enzyme